MRPTAEGFSEEPSPPLIVIGPVPKRPDLHGPLPQDWQSEAHRATLAQVAALLGSHADISRMHARATATAKLLQAGGAISAESAGDLRSPVALLRLASPEGHPDINLCALAVNYHCTDYGTIDVYCQGKPVLRREDVPPHSIFACRFYDQQNPDDTNAHQPGPADIHVADARDLTVIVTERHDDGTESGYLLDPSHCEYAPSGPHAAIAKAALRRIERHTDE